MSKQETIAVLFHRVGPYHFARLRAAGRLLSIHLIEVFQGDEIYAWAPVLGADGFTRETLFPSFPQAAPCVAEACQQALTKCAPMVVVIPGWSDSVAYSALLWCRLNHVPVIIMTESTMWDEPRTGWKEFIKRRLLRITSAALAGGSSHVAYLKHLGVCETKISFGYDAVDNDYFSAKAGECLVKRTENRERFGLPEKFFLASARFVEKKNLLRLLDAYARYRDLVASPGFRSTQHQPWKLVLLGDGPLRASLQSRLSILNLRDHVQMPGFKQYDELPRYFALASAFVHASTTEQWGLVVNEAMASGLPVLVSNRCGCAADLVQEGVNGFSFDPYDVEALAQLMQKLSASDFPLSEFGIASQRIISNWGTERFAHGLSQAVAVALQSSVPRPGLLDRLLLRLLLLRS